MKKKVKSKSQLKYILHRMIVANAINYTGKIQTIVFKITKYIRQT